MQARSMGLFKSRLFYRQPTGGLYFTTHGLWDYEVRDTCVMVCDGGNLYMSHFRIWVWAVRCYSGIGSAGLCSRGGWRGKAAADRTLSRDVEGHRLDRMAW